MNVPATKSLSARVMEWQARPWRVVKTEGGKEYRVQRALTAMGHETFVPARLRWSPVSRGYPREFSEVPLIPRKVFARLELSVLWNVIETAQHVIGVECDAERSPEAISDAQMELFIATHAEWLSVQQKQAASGKVMGRGIRTAKRRSVPFRDALMELQRQFDNDIKSA